MIFPAAIVAPKFGEELSSKEELYFDFFSISGALCSRQHLERVKIMLFTITPGLGQLSQVFEDFYHLKTFSPIFLIPLRSTAKPNRVKPKIDLYLNIAYFSSSP